MHRWHRLPPRAAARRRRLAPLRLPAERGQRLRDRRRADRRRHAARPRPHPQAVEGRGISAHALTHAHPDHYGASHAICDRLGHPAVVRRRRRRGGRARQDGLEGRAHDPRPAGPPVARRLSEGDEVAGFTVLETPGHSPGHVSYWRESDRTLICGDVMWGWNPFLLRGPIREPLDALQRPTRRATASRPAASPRSSPRSSASATGRRCATRRSWRRRSRSCRAERLALSARPAARRPTGSGCAEAQRAERGRRDRRRRARPRRGSAARVRRASACSQRRPEAGHAERGADERRQLRRLAGVARAGDGDDVDLADRGALRRPSCAGRGGSSAARARRWRARSTSARGAVGAGRARARGPASPGAGTARRLATATTIASESAHSAASSAQRRGAARRSRRSRPRAPPAAGSAPAAGCAC